MTQPEMKSETNPILRDLRRELTSRTKCDLLQKLDLAMMAVGDEVDTAELSMFFSMGLAFLVVHFVGMFNQMMFKKNDMDITGEDAECLAAEVIIRQLRRNFSDMPHEETVKDMMRMLSRKPGLHPVLERMGGYKP